MRNTQPILMVTYRNGLVAKSIRYFETFREVEEFLDECYRNKFFVIGVELI